MGVDEGNLQIIDVDMTLYCSVTTFVLNLLVCLKKIQNAPRPSEHPPVRGGKISKRFGGIKGCK